jgi:hypothetical protein
LGNLRISVDLGQCFSARLGVVRIDQFEVYG